ncbi:Rhodanese-like domain-containing protein [Cunninghamella echinulata]|nr:Rhodanese-like domain-containing protein [Cunninghamella echinulata]
MSKVFATSLRLSKQSQRYVFNAYQARLPLKPRFNTTLPLIQTYPSIVSSRFYNTPTSPFPVVEFEDIQDIIKKQDKNIELIDVREKKEVSQGYIPTAKNVPLSQLEQGWALSDSQFESEFGFSKPNKDKTLVLYCLGGVRSTKAANILQQQYGYNNIRNYVGSWADYSEKIKNH